MKPASLIFRIAAFWGILLLTPIFFLRQRIALQSPPPITHPEYFFGFLTVTLVVQILFLAIASDPVRYRPIMLVAILEKFAYALVILKLVTTRQADSTQAVFASTDFFLGLLFLYAFLKTPRRAGPHL